MSTQRRENGLVKRLRLTLVAAVYLVLAVPALFLLIFITVSLGISFVGVGLVFLLLLVPLNRQLANVHRTLSGVVLGTPIPRPYAVSEARNPLQLLRNWATDSARWRDFLWTFLSVSAGWILAWLSIGLFALWVWYLVFPFVYAVSADGTFDMNYGILQIDSSGKSFLEWIWLLPSFAAWWWLVPVLVRWRAQIDWALLAPSQGQLERRVAQVAASRSETLDHSASELRRIERDLHDGAQARLVSLGMNLGMAQELLAKDPSAAGRLITQAQDATTSALSDIRSVVRGIHPPVLADRGLAGAVQALALDMAIPVAVTVTLRGRVAEPVESAVYFAIAECLANVAKHADAHRATVDLEHDGVRLRALVGDDGHGGADVRRGTGLAGVARRLNAFDGTIRVVSPVGGPTVITLEVPCALLSPKTTPSSATG